MPPAPKSGPWPDAPSGAVRTYGGAAADFAGATGADRPLTEGELETLEILLDPDAMKAIEESIEVMRAGRVVEWRPSGACSGGAAASGSAGSACNVGSGNGKKKEKEAGAAEEYGRLQRILPSRQRHPARLVGDAIDMLGRAQDSIRGKKCRRAIVKARNILIGMLDGGAPRCTGNTSAAPSGGGGDKKRQRQKQRQGYRQRQKRRAAK